MEQGSEVIPLQLVLDNHDEEKDLVQDYDSEEETSTLLAQSPDGKFWMARLRFDYIWKTPRAIRTENTEWSSYNWK